MAVAAPDLLEALDDLGRLSGRLRLVWLDYSEKFLATYEASEVVGRERFGRDFIRALSEWDAERWEEIGIDLFAYLSPAARLDYTVYPAVLGGLRPMPI